MRRCLLLENEECVERGSGRGFPKSDEDGGGGSTHGTARDDRRLREVCTADDEFLLGNQECVGAIPSHTQRVLVLGLYGGEKAT